jgi:hypothetical protein
MMSMQGSVMHQSMQLQQPQQSMFGSNNNAYVYHHRTRPEDAATHITVSFFVFMVYFHCRRVN